MTAVTFPSGLTLADARALLVGVDVSVAVVRLAPGEQTGTMLAPPIDKTITNVTRAAIILDGGTRRHTSIDIATGATARKDGVVTKVAPDHAQRIRDLLGVETLPISDEAPARKVVAEAVKETLLARAEQRMPDEATPTQVQRTVAAPRRSSPEQMVEAIHELRTDAHALFFACLDTLNKVPRCACGAVSTVADRVARVYVCDSCAPDHAKGSDQPWAPVARAVARLTAMPVGLFAEVTP